MRLTELPDVAPGIGAQVGPERGRGADPGEHLSVAPSRSRSMSSIESAPAAIPATRHVTFSDAPTPHRRRGARPGQRSGSPARAARAVTGTRPACATRFGSSNTARVFARLMQQCRVAPARYRAGAPSEPCVPVDPAHGSSKPRGRLRLKLWFRFPALAGVEPALAGRVHEAGLVTVRRAGPPVVDEVAGCYRPAGDVQPPSFPLRGRLGWLLGGQQVVPA